MSPKFPMILAEWTDKSEDQPVKWRVVASNPMNDKTWTIATIHLSLERDEGPDSMGRPVWCNEDFDDGDGVKFAAFFDEMLKQKMGGK